MTYPNGTTYAGEWKDGSENGLGTYTSNNVVYEGQFLNAKFSGNGSSTYTDGSTYVGQFKNGKKQGPGEYSWKNGCCAGVTFVGEFAEDNLTSDGTFFHEVDGVQDDSEYGDFSVDSSGRISCSKL